MGVQRLSPEAPIEEKIAWAKAWWLKAGERLHAEEETAFMANLLRTAIGRSRRSMVELGIVDACGDCERNGGSCCGAGLENRYTDLLLLVNLLLGVELPLERLDRKSCFFLGERGCRLAARHVLCINYLCRGITSRIDPARMAELRAHEGNEIHLLFRLNEHLLKIILSENPRSLPLEA